MIGSIKLPDFPLLLAPMEDVSDPPFRYVCKQQGADMMCGVHCINALLQGPYFDEVTMSNIALSLDQKERDLMAEAGLRCAPGALAGTYPAALLGRRVPPWLAIPIDVVLAGGGAHAVSRRRGPAIGSDHWPVVIELVLADRGDFKPTA